MVKTVLIGDQFSSRWCHFSTTITFFNQVICRTDKVKPKKLFSFILNYFFDIFCVVNYWIYKPQFKKKELFVSWFSHSFSNWTPIAEPHPPFLFTMSTMKACPGIAFVRQPRVMLRMRFSVLAHGSYRESTGCVCIMEQLHYTFAQCSIVRQHTSCLSDMFSCKPLKWVNNKVRVLSWKILIAVFFSRGGCMLLQMMSSP